MMKTTVIYTFIVGIIISLFVMFAGCDKSEDLSPLPEKFIFSLSEKFYPDSSQIIIKVRSEEEYSCMNFEIIYSKDKSGESNVVVFEGITNHGYCATAIGPAKTNITIANGEDTGIKTFDFTADDDHDFFEFSILQDYVTMNLLGTKSGRIEFEHEKMFRLSKNTFWGYTENLTKSDSLHNAFMDDLLELGVEIIEPQDGYYGFFTVEGGELYFDKEEKTSEDNIIPFVFLYEGSLNDICEVADLYNEDLYIFVRNAEGDQCEFDM